MEIFKRTGLYSFILIVVTIILSSILIGCKDPVSTNDDELTITMTFQGPRAQGNYYSGYLPKTDWAIWIKNSQNECVKTLKINTGAVKIGKYGSHVYHLPAWLACTGDSVTDIPDADSIPDRFDGVTAASYTLNNDNPSKTVTATWDFTDANGNTVSDGDYYFCAEAANIQKDSSATEPSGYTLSVIAENTAGTVTYPGGTVVNADNTANILSCIGVVD